MKLLLLFMAISISTLSLGQATLSKQELWKILTTTYDTLNDDLRIDFASRETDNQDSSFFKSDTILFYRNIHTSFCDTSISPCHTVT